MDAAPISSMSIKRVQVGSREYNQLRVWVGGLMLTCDVTNRQILGTAKRVAQSHGLELEIADDVTFAQEAA